MGADKAKPLTSKWLKTKVLLDNDRIRPLIPETRKFSRSNLSEMIRKYGMIYVKPERGTYGNGVMKVEQESSGRYAYQFEQKRLIFDQFDAFYSSLSRRIGKRSYLIQKGIYLLKHNNRRFDIRVMVQLSPDKKWEATGIIGRLGHPQKIVTNYHSGGKPMDFHKLLESHASLARRNVLYQELQEVGLQIARHMGKKYPFLRQIGVDVGLDHSMKPWIIEVNVKPDPYIFNQLKDKSMYRKVIRYYRYYNKKMRY